MYLDFIAKRRFFCASKLWIQIKNINAGRLKYYDGRVIIISFRFFFFSKNLKSYYGNGRNACLYTCTMQSYCGWRCTRRMWKGEEYTCEIYMWEMTADAINNIILLCVYRVRVSLVYMGKIHGLLQQFTTISNPALFTTMIYTRTPLVHIIIIIYICSTSDRILTLVGCGGMAIRN